MSDEQFLTSPFLPARFHLFSHQLKFFLRGPGPLGPGSSCPVGSKTCHVLLDDCQKLQTGPKSVESKETRLFKAVFF